GNSNGIRFEKRVGESRSRFETYGIANRYNPLRVQARHPANSIQESFMRRVLLSLGLLLALSFTLLADDWPQWRGPDRTGISKETGLLQTWPKDGPTLRWKAGEIGTGYSAPIVVKGRVYLQTTKEKDEFA